MNRTAFSSGRSSRTPPDSPVLIVVAGPNGSGKTTLTNMVTFGADLPVIDPDAVAISLPEENATLRGIRAARVAILRCRELLGAGESFLIETTLAGNGALALMRQARQAGYRVSLIYIALSDPELHIERVRLRVALGGHDVPDADIRCRFVRSLSRAPEAIRIAHEAVLIDNSGSPMKRVLSTQNGQITWHSRTIPHWIEEIVSKLR